MDRKIVVDKSRWHISYRIHEV